MPTTAKNPSPTKLLQQLKRAVKANDEAEVKALVDELKGLGTPVGCEMLEIAAWRGHLRCAEHLLPITEYPDRALMVAADGARSELVRFLLPHCDAKATFSRHGNTALHRAAYRGSIECVELLLMASDPHQKSYRGYTALDWATKFSRKGKSKAKLQRVIEIIESYPARKAAAEAAEIESIVTEAETKPRQSSAGNLRL